MCVCARVLLIDLFTHTYAYRFINQKKRTLQPQPSTPPGFTNATCSASLCWSTYLWGAKSSWLLDRKRCLKGTSKTNIQQVMLCC